MKTSQMLLAALLSLGFSSVACAQIATPGVPGTVGVPATPAASGASGTAMPNQTGALGTTLPSTSTPLGTSSGSTYSTGTMPADASGTLRSNRPAGAAPSRSARKTQSGTRTTNSTVRP